MTRAQIQKAMFDADWKACLALEAARNAELAAARGRAMNDVALRAELLADANRRGRNDIDWPEYFRNSRLT